MSIKDQLFVQGEWLFKRRSFLPLLFVLFVLVVLVDLKINGTAQYDRGKPYEFFCFFIAVIGLAVRCLTGGYVPAGTSGRITHGFEASVLNTSSMYSIVRHPLYVGNFLIYLGLSLYLEIWWLCLIYLLLFWLYYERIAYAEEHFLSQKFGEEFDSWAKKTPGFIPNPSLWTTSGTSFSFRTVLKREYSAVLAIAAVFSFLDIFRNALFFHKFVLDILWVIVLPVSAIIYLTLRFLKKRTKLLDISG